MKASTFDYARAASVEEALQLLVAHGDQAKVLSGGQSLMPAMNLRVIAPAVIVDIGNLDELRGLSVRGDHLTIGALTRHVELLKSPEIAAHAPLLTEAAAHIAHPAIRNRGTIGGSLAQADPASELPACMVALAATIVVRGPAGERRIAARDFFTGIFQTALSPQELLTSVELPLARQHSAWFFHEFARRHGDYAITGLAAQASLQADGFSDLRMVFFAVGDRPMLAVSTDRLIGVPVTPALLSDAAAALESELDPMEDQQASASMRRHLSIVLLKRCVGSLLRRADLYAGDGA
jgi:carbon-monoxide dehydrogenase medium subunit